MGITSSSEEQPEPFYDDHASSTYRQIYSAAPPVHGENSSRGLTMSRLNMSEQSLNQQRLTSFIDKSKATIEGTSSPFSLKFSFTSLEKCEIRVFFFTQCSSYFYSAGKDQLFSQEIPNLLEYSLGVLAFHDRNIYPLVIQISDYKTSQTTYFIIEKQNDKFALKCVRQQAHINGQTLEMMDIFGINESTDCVICLSAEKNTAMIPCNHVCMCHECAERMRAQLRPVCPICRGRVTELRTLNRES